MQALGTIASSINMANKTPGKSLLRPPNHQHVLECCNFSFVSNPIDLLGAKSESENRLSSIVKVIGLGVQ